MITWQYVGAAVAGTSHLAKEIPCQDHYSVNVFDDYDGFPILAAFVSDGAGSASHGGTGAQLAVRTALTWIEDHLQERICIFDDESILKLIKAVRQSLIDYAMDERLTVRDLACTFLGLVSSPTKTRILQVGDGAVTIDRGLGLELPIFPMHGEYASSTCFITEQDAIEKFQTVDMQSATRRAALLTDGLERLAIDMAEKRPFSPFFEPLLRAVNNILPEQKEAAKDALESFLNSEKVNSRTDDDKTLILINSIERT